MPAPYRIEPATWRDLNEVRQVEKACFGEDAWPLWDMAAALTFPNIIRLKAVVDGHLVGFVAGDIRRSEGLGWITTIGVVPEFRRMGIASEMLALTEQQMRMPRVKLCVRQSNEAAIRLYERYGYDKVGIWPHYYQDGEDALVMEKRTNV